MKKTLEITLEQARELLKTTPSLKDVIYENFPELKPSIVPDSWENLVVVKGYYIDDSSEILDVGSFVPRSPENKNTYAELKQAKAALAFAQLTQLMEATGDCDVDWCDRDKEKYVIMCTEEGLYIHTYYTAIHHLAFNNFEIAFEFMTKHERLIKEFYMQD